MRSQSAFRRLLVTTLATVALAGATGRAWADDKQECSDAYDQAQTLRNAGKLQAAHHQAAACMRGTCAEFIRTDCSKWLGEIDQSQPTVIFEVHDAGGHEMRAVQVALDGNPWLDTLYGAAKPIDPGHHTLHYVIDGDASIDDTVEIYEGQKNRKLIVSFDKASPEKAVPEKVGTEKPAAERTGKDEKPVVSKKNPSPVPLETRLSSRSPAPWVFGGIGVGALLVGAITGGLVLHDKSVAEAECPNNKCDADRFSKVSEGRALGPVTTVALVVGGVGVGVGAIWLIARPSAPNSAPKNGGPKAPPEAALSMGPVVNMSGAAWRFEGSF